jgi:hypothetical protein
MVEKNNNDVLFKLYQYTMPFIKHNRLNFPPRRYVSKTVLKHLIQIVAFSCLGLHVHQSKKPVWNVRRKLFIFFTNLMLKGSLSDLYIFCHHHNYLVRLALIENFVHFTNQSMTLEMKFMRVFSGIAYEHTKVFRLVCYIADNFRMSALQNETLDWEVVELKAQIAIERCNRTCKSQPIKQIRLLTSVHNCWGYATENYLMRNLMTMPVVSKPMLFRDNLQSFKKDDNLLGKLEALDQRTREQMSLLREGHNSLLDAHKTCQQQVTSLSQLCSRPQERHVEFGANSYLQPPRSKFGR